MVEDLKDYLEKAHPTDEEEFLDNLSYTLGQRRTRFRWVASHAASSLQSLKEALALDRFKPGSNARTPKDRPCIHRTGRSVVRHGP